MRRQAVDFSTTEVRNVRDFVAFAVSRVGTQSELARLSGVAQPTINALISGARGPGSKSLRSIASAMGVTTDDIVSGAGLQRLRALSGSQVDVENHTARSRAARALAELFELPIAEVFSLFDSLGIALPESVSATAWFDIARAAHERRSASARTTELSHKSDVPSGPSDGVRSLRRV